MGLLILKTTEYWWNKSELDRWPLSRPIIRWPVERNQRLK